MMALESWRKLPQCLPVALKFAENKQLQGLLTLQFKERILQVEFLCHY